jgi:hypothetical protein
MKSACFLLLAMAGLLQAREFTGKNGNKTEAEIVSRTETHVELRLKDGKVVKTAIASLSSADQLFVKTWEDPKEKIERLKSVDPAEVLAAKGYFSLEVETGTGPMILLASINGKPARLMIDDGVEVPLIKKASLEKLDLVMNEVPTQGKVEGNTVIGKVQPKSFGGDAGSFAPQECYVLTLEHLPQNVVDGIDGVIGGQFFVDHSAVLDYAAKKLWMKK